jgi:hypothetical protein
VVIIIMGDHLDKVEILRLGNNNVPQIAIVYQLECYNGHCKPRMPHPAVCNPACGPNFVCNSKGQCVCPTIDGYTQCDTSCVDLQSDPNNCGSCGNDCSVIAPLSICQSGTCKCTAGTEPCGPGMVCTFTQGSDVNNCGGCGIKCPTGSSCQSGICRCFNGTHFILVVHASHWLY